MNKKPVYYLLLIALLFCSNGCISSATLQRARGYTDERVEPLKGDTVFLHNGFNYVIQQKHPEGKNAEKMLSAYEANSRPPYRAYRPDLTCYPFLLIAIPLDAVTLPFQAIGGGLVYLMYSNATHF